MKERFPDKFLGWLKKEIDKWLKESIISEEQSNLLKEKYGLLDYGEKNIPSKIIISFSIIGALLIGSGVILLVASNWALIPNIVKLFIILCSIFIVNHFGYYLKYTKGNYPKIGEALLFLGALLFGAGGWLIAQSFNILTEDPNGVLFWGLGILPIAWLLEIELILVLSSCLISVWGIWAFTIYQGPNFLYPLFMLGFIIPLCYKQKATFALFLSLIGISLWLGFGPLQYTFDKGELFIGSYLIFSALLYSISITHNFFDRVSLHSISYKIIGLIVMFGFMYSLSFKFLIHDLTRATIKESTPVIAYIIFGGLFFLTLFSVIVNLLITRKKSQSQKMLEKYEIIYLLFLLLIASSISLFPNAIFYVLISNIMLLIISIGLIFLGYYSHQKFKVNLGFLFFLTHFFTRYIDWGWQFFPRAVFFIIAGSLLILCATFLERKRKKMIKEITLKVNDD